MGNTRRSILTFGATAMFWPFASVSDQTTTSMVIYVRPETYLEPSRVAIQLNVPADRTQPAPLQIEMLRARARVLPNQSIRVTATLSGLTGPTGSSAAIVRWAGSRTTATGGGQTGACTSGEPLGNGAVDLVSNWLASGTITCVLRFSLANSTELTPGQYRGMLDVKLIAE